jgi:ABC-type glutathione transport system ATPase component
MIDVKELSVRYKGSETEAVKGVSFTLEQGSFTGLVGESGSGKTTIISSILGLLPHGTSVSGSIAFEGNDLLSLSGDRLRELRWKRISLVPQGALNSFTPVLTIGRHIEEVLETHCGIKRAAAGEKIAALLTECGLDEEAAQKYPHELSGGQKQRAAIALALACSPLLLLADEPTTALDVITQAGILKLLAGLRAERGLTVLLVTHDLPLAASVCDRLLVMKDGELIESGAPREIVLAPKRAYTKKLVEAIL